MRNQGGKPVDISNQEMIDLTRALDPASRNERPRKRFR
jgi:hypothetical protein